MFVLFLNNLTEQQRWTSCFFINFVKYTYKNQSAFLFLLTMGSHEKKITTQRRCVIIGFGLTVNFSTIEVLSYKKKSSKVIDY